MFFHHLQKTTTTNKQIHKYINKQKTQSINQETERMPKFGLVKFIGLEDSFISGGEVGQKFQLRDF